MVALTIHAPLSRQNYLPFNGHFTDEPGLAGARMSPFRILLELRMMEVVVTTRLLQL